MKEVKLKCFAGPFENILYQHYVQSLIGLVPKAGGKTRLIFHLSYDFQNGNQSINYWTPESKCTVKYHDLDHAVFNGLYYENILNASRIFLAKTVLMSAFRRLPVILGHWRLLILKVEHPETGKVMYFIDKCLPFGASISCSHFQRFSNALLHIVNTLTGKHHSITNYLDDSLFIEEKKEECNKLVREFLKVCDLIKFPVAKEKTEWASVRIVFLGVLLDGDNFRLCVPEEKRLKALNLVQNKADRKKAKIQELQHLTGTLNFLCRILHPGRTFMRRMYQKFANMKEKRGVPLKHYHHVKLDSEFKRDCQVWQMFLENATSKTITRPFIDFNNTDGLFDMDILQFYTNASANVELGMGC